MTRDRNDHPASPPSMTLPQPLSYPPLPNHSYRIHHYPTTPPLPTLLPPYCIILLLLPFPSPTPYTPTPTTNVLLPTHPYHHHTTPYSPPPILPYPYSPPALTFSIRSPLYTPTTIHCLTLPSPPSLPCPTISHSVKPPAYS